MTRAIVNTCVAMAFCMLSGCGNSHESELLREQEQLAHLFKDYRGRADLARYGRVAQSGIVRLAEAAEIVGRESESDGVGERAATYELAVFVAGMCGGTILSSTADASESVAGVLKVAAEDPPEVSHVLLGIGYILHGKNRRALYELHHVDWASIERPERIVALLFSAYMYNRIAAPATSEKLLRDAEKCALEGTAAEQWLECISVMRAVIAGRRGNWQEVHKALNLLNRGASAYLLREVLMAVESISRGGREKADQAIAAVEDTFFRETLELHMRTGNDGERTREVLRDRDLWLTLLTSSLSNRLRMEPKADLAREMIRWAKPFAIVASGKQLNSDELGRETNTN